MKSIEKSVIDSLDERSVGLYPFIFFDKGLREAWYTAKELIKILANPYKEKALL